MELLIISGLSGAGKSQASKFLEDTGFYTVDNIPPEFMPQFAAFCTSRYERVAIVCDARSGDSAQSLLDALDEVKKLVCSCKLIFLEADLPTIIRRYKETRRLHPLAGKDGSLEDAAKQERELLLPIRARADYVLDTTPFASIGQLRLVLENLFGSDTNHGGIAVNVMSFGFKYGLPLEADLVMDARFLPNPYYIPELRVQTGKDPAVREYLEQFDITHSFVDKLEDMISFLLPHYAEEGKQVLTVAIGCTGGRHRSVAVACEMVKRLKASGYAVSEYHRDVTRA